MCIRDRSNGVATVSGACFTGGCKLNGGTGYSQNNVATGSGSISCDEGFAGSVSYNCSAFGVISGVSSTCAPIKCKLIGFSGIANTNDLAYTDLSEPFATLDQRESLKNLK